MTRVKRGTIHTKRRRNILRKAKGYSRRRKSHLRQARQAIIKAGQYALRDRRRKKGIFRRLWNIQISAALREHGISYSVFIHEANKQSIQINRKMLSQLASEQPEAFSVLVSNIVGTKEKSSK